MTADTAGGSPERIAEIRPAWLEALEGLPARGHLVERRTQSEDVRAGVGRLSLDLFGRHVRERPDDRPLSRDVRRRGVRRGQAVRRLARLGEPEVEQLDSRLRQHHVGGLQVPVHDALAVRRGERSADLRTHLRDLARRQRTAGEAIGQRLAVEQLRHRIGDAAVAAEIVQREDVRMGEPRDRARLALEPRQRRRVSSDFLRQHLDGHLAPEPRVPRPVDLPHSARTEGREDLVGTEPGPGRQGHFSGSACVGAVDRPAREPEAQHAPRRGSEGRHPRGPSSARASPARPRPQPCRPRPRRPA